MYTFRLYNRNYKTFRFPSIKSANHFMNWNEEWGMIGYQGKWIHVARISDKGVVIKSEDDKDYGFIDLPAWSGSEK